MLVIFSWKLFPVRTNTVPGRNRSKTLQFGESVLIIYILLSIFTPQVLDVCHQAKAFFSSNFKTILRHKLY